MTDEQKSAALAAELLKARRFVEDGDALLARASYDSAVDRFYYAAFHAASAALASRGIEARSHEGPRNLFGLHLVKPGLVEAELGTALRRLHGDRLDADYLQYLAVEETEAREAARLARKFVDAIEALLQRESAAR
jgi:uncharacterized protein (UPF0332 family)